LPGPKERDRTKREKQGAGRRRAFGIKSSSIRKRGCSLLPKQLAKTLTKVPKDKKKEAAKDMGMEM
jgi:hypothetical protein